MVSEKYSRWGLLFCDAVNANCGPICTDSADCARFSLIINFILQYNYFKMLFWRFSWLPAQTFAYFSFILPCSQKASECSSDDEAKELHTVAPVPTQTNHVQTQGSAPCHSFRKSLRLSSDQIVRWLVNFTGCFSDMCEVRETFTNPFKQAAKHKSDSVLSNRVKYVLS